MKSARSLDKKPARGCSTSRHPFLYSVLLSVLPSLLRCRSVSVGASVPKSEKRVVVKIFCVKARVFHSFCKKKHAGFSWCRHLNSDFFIKMRTRRRSIQNTGKTNIFIIEIFPKKLVKSKWVKRAEGRRFALKYRVSSWISALFLSFDVFNHVPVNKNGFYKDIFFHFGSIIRTRLEIVQRK